LDDKPLNFATIGYILDIEPKSVYNWYRNYLSEFTQEVESGEFHQYDMQHSDDSVLPVPILKPENMGNSMVIDEKMINDEMYTILSNRETGKIALLAQTMKFDDLTQLAEHFGEKTMQVDSINSDMSPVYTKFCKHVFVNATHTVDKFHVISQVLESLQAVRIRLKSEEMAKLPKKKTKKNDPEKQMIEDQKIHQIETKIQMLTRCCYLLFKRANTWKPWQAARAKQLFELFPILHQGHMLVEQIRDWYDRKNIGNTFLSVDRKLSQWIENVEIANINEMNGLVKMFHKHYDEIINYCFRGQTNAKAENINSRIQRFINVNYGVRDEDFFFFRLKKYFT